jgi:hypothetical protein
MAVLNWTSLLDSLSEASVEVGATSAVTPPPHGASNTQVLGFNSLDVNPGAVGIRLNSSGFSPLTKGGNVHGAMQRGLGGGPTGYSVFFFVGLQGTSVLDNGYLLGLSDENPARIILAKTRPVDGIPNASSPVVLRVSDAAIAQGEWAHLRLDMTVNENGDVLLDAFRSDLTSEDVDSPVWDAIPGIDQFVDDRLGVSSGSVPYTSGYVGLGFQTQDVTRRGFFDQIEAKEQA